MLHMCSSAYSCNCSRGRGTLDQELFRAVVSFINFRGGRQQVAAGRSRIIYFYK